MPLKLTLKPNEKVLIGTSVIANGPAKTEFVVLNRVPVVREKDIITEEKADTIAKKLANEMAIIQITWTRYIVFACMSLLAAMAACCTTAL